jgi:hypothetical protein
MSGRYTASGRCASVRADVGAAELAAAGDDAAHVSGRSSASEKGGTSEKSLSSETGATMRGGGDDNGGR